MTRFNAIIYKCLRLRFAIWKPCRSNLVTDRSIFIFDVLDFVSTLRFKKKGSMWKKMEKVCHLKELTKNIPSEYKLFNKKIYKHF